MKSLPTAPAPGTPVSSSLIRELIDAIKARTILQGRGYRTRETPNGTFLDIDAKTVARQSPSPLHPWKVFAVGKSENIDHCFEIYVPAGAVHIGEDEIAVNDLTPVEDEPDRYTLDCEQEISDEAVIYLAILKEESSSEEGEPSEPEWKARVISALEAIEDAKDVLVVLPIAKLKIDGSGEYDVGKVIAQYAHSSVAMPPGVEKENEKAPLPGRFDIQIESGEESEESEATSHTATFSNCYYDVGGKTYETSVEELELSGGEIIALKVTARGSSPSAEIVTYGSITALQEAQGDKDYYVRPLYKIGSEFAIECDFRTGPTFDMGEFWT